MATATPPICLEAFLAPWHELVEDQEHRQGQHLARRMGATPRLDTEKVDLAVYRSVELAEKSAADREGVREVGEGPPEDLAELGWGGGVGHGERVSVLNGCAPEARTGTRTRPTQSKGAPARAGRLHGRASNAVS